MPKKQKAHEPIVENPVAPVVAPPEPTPAPEATVVTPVAPEPTPAPVVTHGPRTYPTMSSGTMRTDN